MKLFARAAVAALVAALSVFGAGVAHAGATAAGAAYSNFDAAGEHTVVVLPVYWTAPDAQTTTSLRALARQMGDYWSEQTNGAITVPEAKITVRDWMSIADPVTCDRDAIFYAALGAANERAGAYHKHVIVYFPQTAYCTWKGSGSAYPEYEGNIYHSVYGWMWINGYTSVDVWAREFGRNFGLGSARAATCYSGATQVPLSDTCSTRDGYDYDLMGADRGGDPFTLNTALADRIGLLDPNAVRTASVGASFTLAPVSSHTGLMAVKVPLSGSFLYVEYRPRVGRDANEPPGWSGVQVRQRDTWGYFSRVLALNPDGSDGLLANVAARVGVGWDIPGTYLTLVVDSADAAGARIRFAARPDSTPPPVPQAPTAGGTATASGTAQRDGIIGGNLYVNWPALDDPESGLAAFHVYVDDTEVRTVGGTTFASDLPALTPGAHRVRVDATNNAGLTTAGAETTFHTEPAPPAPDAPTVTAATHGSQLGGELTLDWPTVAGGDITGYQIYVDEALLDTVGPGSSRYRADALPTGYHSARVAAVNALGLGVSSAATGFWVDASPPPVPAAPTVTAAVQQHGVLRGALQVSWLSVNDPDSGTVAYRVYVGDTLVADAPTAGNPVQVNAQPSGTYRLRVDAVNGAGLTATGATTTIRVDGSTPVVSMPTVVLRPGTAAAGTPVTITASAVDTGAGICAMTTTVDGRVVGTGSSGALRVNATLPAGGTATVRVTARDCVGNEATATTPVTVSTAAETAARYTSGWSTRRSGAYAGRTAKVSARAGAVATYRFTGSQVAWIGSRSGTTGAATVYLDGKRVATAQTRGRTANRQLIWAATTGYGRHTLKIVVNGPPGRSTVVLDGFITAHTPQGR
ncbi:hypothetical protein [Krasilnikovia sp. MM14-A1259]|uniref:hypothetical protein n=1 Tax=Krasilnikovia sp. MM14-A1259 TaxID=3373539 RepID=UPI00381615C6